ncbi:Hypothetical protein A7982_03247 [Minicystis rosea]|nr:Hypothetical protein A7982_03247 [Minicystis rosea]
MLAPAMTKVTVQRRAAALLAALLLLGAAACEKGESQGAAGGYGGEGGEGGEGGTGGEGGGVPACGTCAFVFTNGGTPCDAASSDAYTALYACGCGPCASACGGTLCTSAPPDATCGKCLETSCAAQAAECAQN